MFILGNRRYITFRIVDIDDQPVLGRTLEDLSVLFLRNNELCSDPLEFQDLGNGRYSVMYTPSATGHDYLELKDIENDISIIDEDDIVSQDDILGESETVQLNQHYGGSNALLIREPNPDSYILQVFLSSDWDAGRRTDSYAVGSTAIQPTGAWATPLTVTKDTYHLVLMGFRTSKVIRPYLKVQ